VTQSLYTQLTDTPQTATYLAQATLRDILLPLILGDETEGISYWAGKQLATKFPLESIADLSQFFEQINFGQLSLKKQKKNQYFFELTGPIITKRLADFKTPDFQLEAGFIAQTLEQQLQVTAEAKATVENKKRVTIFVQTDTNDPIEIPLETEAMVTMQTPEVTPIAPTEPAEPVTPVATEPTPEPEHEPVAKASFSSVANLPSRQELHRRKKH